ncbi:YqcI/YcgG family protein [Verminephrobacter eiseniae]|nr:YqcI/YcgG family protein [Verminephrobacter eiseniae]
MTDIASRLEGDSFFPCVFAKNAFRKQIIKFIFVEALDDKGIRHLGEGLKAFVEFSRNWDLRVNTASPLIVPFSTAAICADSVEAYHAKGWEVLQRLHEIDPKSWPGDVSHDPENPTWSMCFDGMPLFINMSSPAHKIRRSRNLGGHFMFVINPRERFDIVAGDTPTGRMTRSNIRNRIHRYDGVSHACQLGAYGSESKEWWQYGLVEENIERVAKCPFKFTKKETEYTSD